jgi:hypothetical protein
MGKSGHVKVRSREIQGMGKSGREGRAACESIPPDRLSIRMLSIEFVLRRRDRAELGVCFQGEEFDKLQSR